jgi:hypothetical protein
LLNAFQVVFVAAKTLLNARTLPSTSARQWRN